MTPDEWKATAAVRRELVELRGHFVWSKLSDAQRDEAVREEVARRAR
jgi:hypothetical protein